MEPRGVVFGATGPGYAALAAEAARGIKAHDPDLPVDLFTDQPPLPPFDAVHPVDPDFFRPKFAALSGSRFARTLYLDADVVVLASIADVFEVLERFDIALAHDPYRASDHALALHTHAMPAAFPQFNGGVIAARHSARALWEACADALRQTGAGRDQPILRELIYLSDLRVATLPPEYNFMGLPLLNDWSSYMPAPRIVHSPRLHAGFTKGRATVGGLERLLGRRAARHLQRLVDADPTLGGSGARVRPLTRRGAMALLSGPLGLIRRRFER